MLHRLGHPAAFIALTLLLGGSPFIVAAHTSRDERGILSSIASGLMGQGRARTSYHYDHVFVVQNDDGSLAAYDMYDLENAQIDWGDAIFGDDTTVPCAELFSYPKHESFGLLTSWVHWGSRYYRLTFNEGAPCAGDHAAIEAVLRSTSTTSLSEDYPDLRGVMFNAANDRYARLNPIGLAGDIASLLGYGLWCVSLTQLRHYSRPARRERANCCPSCSYPRDGLNTTSCPECGKPVPSTHAPWNDRVR